MTDQRTPTLSICVPSHNTGRFVRTTIESALAQTQPVAEVLISDDHSTDSSMELIERYSGVPNVRIIRPATRLTLGEHYRFLVENARSDYVCLLSADDALVPTFAERMLRDLPLDDSVGMVIGGWIETDEALKARRVRGLRMPRGTLHAPQGVRHFAGGCGYIISAAILCRRRLLELDLLPPEASLPTDWYWALRLAAEAEVRFVDEPMAYYRFHDSNSSHSDPNRWRRAALAMIQFTRERLPDDQGHWLDGTVTDLEGSLAQDPDYVPVSDPTLRLKRLAAGLLALYYRRLPDVLERAEQGASPSLERALRM